MEHFYYGQHSPSRVRHLATTPIEQRSYYRQPPPPFASSSLLLSRSGEYQNYDTDDDQLQQEPPTTFHRYRSASAAYNSEQSNFSGSAKGPYYRRSRASSIQSAAPSFGGSCRSRRADSHNGERHKSRNVGRVEEEDGKNLGAAVEEDHNILLPNSVGKCLIFLLLLVAIVILLSVFTSSNCDTIALSCCGMFSYITKSLQTNIKLTHYSAPPI